jgi:DNA-binding response OmpR family regulator
MNTNSEDHPRPRVLVVDDEPAILVALERILQHVGYEVRTARSGSEGLEAFREGSWDLVTLDRAMPGMNGEEMATELRRLAPSLPIVLITGFPQAVVRRDLFDAILPKPFKLNELLAKIAKAIAAHSVQQSCPC